MALVDRSSGRRSLYGGAMDLTERRNLQALEAIADDASLTQRILSNRLGIALGLTNIYLKRLIRKGYVKCINLQSNRLRYLLTPRGIAEKSRLTYDFMQYSLFLYGQVRQHLHAVLEPYTHGELKRMAIYGTGEEAELAYLSIAELGLEMVAVFDRDPLATRFLGRPVRDVSEHAGVAFDLLLVATLRDVEPIVEDLVRLGVPRERLVTLRQ
jgi:DNA-binding MarR family transcriptional regulator